MAKKTNTSESENTSSSEIEKLLNSYIDFAKTMPDDIALGTDTIEDMTEFYVSIGESVSTLSTIFSAVNIDELLKQIGKYDKNPEKATGVMAMLSTVVAIGKPFAEAMSKLAELADSMSVKTFIKLGAGFLMFKKFMGMLPEIMNKAFGTFGGNDGMERFLMGMQGIFGQFGYEIDEKGNINDTNSMGKLIARFTDALNNLVDTLSNTVTKLSDMGAKMVKLYKLRKWFYRGTNVVKTILKSLLDLFNLEDLSKTELTEQSDDNSYYLEDKTNTLNNKDVHTKKFSSRADAFKTATQAAAGIIDAFLKLVNGLSIKKMLKFIIFRPLWAVGIRSFGKLMKDIQNICIQMSEELPENFKKDPEKMMKPYSVMIDNLNKMIGPLTLIGLFGVTLGLIALAGLKVVTKVVTTTVEIAKILTSFKKWAGLKKSMESLMSFTRNLLIFTTLMAGIAVMSVVAGAAMLIGIPSLLMLFGGMYLLFKLIASKTFQKKMNEAAKNLLYLCGAVALLGVTIGILAIFGDLVLKNFGGIMLGILAIGLLLVVTIVSIGLACKLMRAFKMDILIGLTVFLAVAGTILACALAFVAISAMAKQIEWMPIFGFLLAMVGVMVLFGVLGAVSALGLIGAIIFAAAMLVVSVSLIASAALMTVAYGLCKLFNYLTEDDEEDEIKKFINYMDSVCEEMGWCGWSLILHLPGIALFVATTAVACVSLITTGILINVVDALLRGIDFAEESYGKDDYGLTIYKGDNVNARFYNLMRFTKDMLNGLADMFGGGLFSFFRAFNAATTSAALMTAVAPVGTLVKIVSDLAKIDANSFETAYKNIQTICDWFFGKDNEPGISKIIMERLNESSVSYNNSFLSSLNPFADSDQELVAEALCASLDPIETMVDLIKKIMKVDPTKFDDAQYRLQELCNYFFGNKDMGQSGIAGMILEKINGAKDMISYNNSFLGSINPFASSDQELVSDALETALNPLYTMIDIMTKINEMGLDKFDAAKEKLKDITDMFFGTKEEQGIMTIVLNKLREATTTSETFTLSGLTLSSNMFDPENQKKVAESLNLAITPLSTMIDIIEKLANGKYQIIKDGKLTDEWATIDWKSAADSAFDNLSYIIPKFVEIAGLFKGGSDGFFSFGESDFEATTKKINQMKNPINTIIDIFMGAQEKLGSLEKSVVDDLFVKGNQVITGLTTWIVNLGKDKTKVDFKKFSKTTDLLKDLVSNFGEINKIGGEGTADIKNITKKGSDLITAYTGYIEQMGTAKLKNKNEKVYRAAAKSISSMKDSINDINETKANKFIEVFKTMTEFSKEMGDNMDKFVDAISDKLVPALNDFVEEFNKKGQPVVSTANTPVQPMPSSTISKPAESKITNNNVSEEKLNNVIAQLQQMSSALMAIKNSGVKITPNEGTVFRTKELY